MHLAEVTPDNFDAAISITVADDQNDLVAPVLKSLAEAYVHRDTAWPRLVYDGSSPVGFVMAFIDAPWPGTEEKRSGLWRLNIAADRQGRGYGAFTVRAVCDELRSRGVRHVYVTYVPREGGPAPFYRKLGFRVTGEMLDDEAVAVLDL